MIPLGGERERARERAREVEELILEHDCFIMRPSVQTDKHSRFKLLWYPATYHV